MRRLAAAIALTIAVQATTIGGLPIAAEAVTSPQGWQAPKQLDDVVASNIVTHPDGSVTIGNCSTARAAYAVKTFSTTGTVNRAIPDTNPLGSLTHGCDGTWATSPSGVLYTMRTQYIGGDRFAYYLAGYQGSTKAHEIELRAADCTGWETPSFVHMGTDGNVYALLGGCGRYYLAGYTPDLRTRKFHTTVGLRGDFTPFSGGLVLQQGNTLQYYGYTGQRDPTKGYTVPLGTNEVLAGFAPTHTGRVFAQVDTYNQVTPACTLGQVSKRIIVIDPVAPPSNAVWSYNAPACSRFFSLKATPQNGVVFELRPSTGIPQVLALGSTGKNKWPKAFLPPSGTVDGLTYTGGHGLSVDVYGTVVVSNSYSYLTASGSARFGQEFTFLEGTTGEQISRFATKELGISTGVPTGMLLGMAKDRLYLVGCRVNPGATVCNDQPNQVDLYAVTVYGLGLDYPRGKLLGSNIPARTTELNYVAMGDSFASQEGVPEFEPGTDTAGPPANRCHRSTHSYAKLLDNDPSTRLKLAGFVACAGARTRHINSPWLPTDDENKNTNESRQTIVLDPTTQIVTLSIGGNDVGFKGFVLQCLFLDCGDPAVSKQFFDTVGNLNDSLRAAYQSILNAAPNAKVYVVGYPQLLPDPSVQHCTQTDGWMSTLNTLVSTARNGTVNVQRMIAQQAVASIGHSIQLTDSQIDQLIASGVVEFNDNEVRTARDLVQQLDNKIKQTIAGIGSARLIYVDPLRPGTAFSGHELCTQRPYFNGLHVDLSAITLNGGLNTTELTARLAYSFHPNREGAEAYKQLLLSSF